MTDLATNLLSYGDKLDILRRYLADSAVDLVYLDPPFNSRRDDNVIFRDESGNATDAQLLAFEDTWHWEVREGKKTARTQLTTTVGDPANRSAAFRIALRFAL